jgi:hypothetical protein
MRSKLVAELFTPHMARRPRFTRSCARRDTDTAERDVAIVMLGDLPLTTGRLTVAADKAYDTRA